jgi:CubicO group peptidase (beta-lactamase class C family)
VAFSKFCRGEGSEKMQNNGWIATFETYVEKVIKESHLPGVTIGLAKDGRVFCEKGFGYRDVENQLKVTSDTVFAIGSITKSFTCVALMQLQEKGKLSLHEPIKKYLPDFHLKNGKYANQMTIHHFMTHTSGIPDLKSFPIALYDSLTDDSRMIHLFEGKRVSINLFNRMKNIWIILRNSIFNCWVNLGHNGVTTMIAMVC